MSSIRFCQDCNNMLFPVQDLNKRVLRFECKREDCEYVREMDPEIPEDNIVSKNNVHNQTKEQIKIQPEVVEDPTLGRARDFVCPNSSCTSTEAVFFQLPERLSEDAMKLILVCIKCKEWKIADSQPTI